MNPTASLICGAALLAVMLFASILRALRGLGAGQRTIWAGIALLALVIGCLVTAIVTWLVL